MNNRYKLPDKKKALDLIQAAERDMKFTLSLKQSQEAASTIVRNIYESFRMLGEALLTNKGVEAEGHLLQIQTLTKLNVETKRPIQTINNLRTLRNNINYNGYTAKLSEVEDAISIAKACFSPLLKEVKRKIEIQKNLDP